MSDKPVLTINGNFNGVADVKDFWIDDYENFCGRYYIHGWRIQSMPPSSWKIEGDHMYFRHNNKDSNTGWTIYQGKDDYKDGRNTKDVLLSLIFEKHILDDNG